MPRFQASIPAIAMALLLALPGPAAAEQLNGRVVRVVDGDTFILGDGTKQTRVRLADVDAPERPGQPFSEASRRSLAQLVAGRNVAVEVLDIDRYGRPVGRVRIGAISVSREQVRRGMAWSSRAYNRDPLLPAIQVRAQAGHMGLWSEANPVSPWEWRRSKK